MPFFSKVKMVYRPKAKKGTLAAAVVLEAFEENFDTMREQVAELADKEVDDMREYFNSVTSEGDLGDVLFGGDYTYEDLQAKVNAMDDESQRQFTAAVQESQLLTIDLPEEWRDCSRKHT